MGLELEFWAIFTYSPFIMDRNVAHDRTQKKRILILGGGISGLSLAYFLSPYPFLEVTLLEKEKRLGGWLETLSEGDFFFERGPRTFRSANLELVSLAHSLGLQEELIYADPAAKKRYLWKGGRFQKVPRMTLPLLKALALEWTRASSSLSDETVWDFVCRRFNKAVAYQVFDLLSIGIYAGDMHKLSMRSCFPLLFQWEKEFGSITKGWWKNRREAPSSLFSFRKGTQSLVCALERNVSATFCLGEEVVSVQPQAHEVVVQTSQRVYRADFVFCALSASSAGALLNSRLKYLPQKGMVVEHYAYRDKLHIPQGFGYIVSSLEKSDVLGVIFDSQIFPQQNRGKKETRLTVMLKEGNADQALSRHLHIKQKPDFFLRQKVESAFPQMEVGYQEKIALIQQEVQQAHPRVALIGNYIAGVGVNDCIRSAKSAAERFLRATAS